MITAGQTRDFVRMRALHADCSSPVVAVGPSPSELRYRRESRVAMVMGSTGYAAAVAQRLASDGLAVAVVDPDQASCARIVDSIVSKGGVAQGVRLGAGGPGEAMVAIERITTRLGPPTVIVGCISAEIGFEDGEPVRQTGIGRTRPVLRTLTVASDVTRSRMAAAGNGRIVLLSETPDSRRGAVHGKHCETQLQRYTRVLAAEFAPERITVNAVAPGFMRSWDHHPAAPSAPTTDDSRTKGAVRHRADDLPALQGAPPEELARAVAFFVRESSRSITGQTLYVAEGEPNQR